MRRQQFKKLDTVTGNAVTQGGWLPQLLRIRFVPIYQHDLVQVERTKSVEILLPFVNQVRRDHHDNRTFSTLDANREHNREGHKGFSHADFVGENDSRLPAKPPEDLLRFATLSLLFGQGYPLICPEAEH